MKVSFTNKKQQKYCNFFVKVLKQTSNFTKVTKESRILYFNFHKKQIKVSPFITDIHQFFVDKSIIFTIKQQAFSWNWSGQDNQNDNKYRIYKIDVIKFFEAMTDFQTKINYMQIIIEDGLAHLTFRTENDENQCTLIQKAQELQDTKWPQDYQSTKDNFYEVIHIISLSQSHLYFHKNKQQKQIWIELNDKGIVVKMFGQGLLILQDKIDAANDNKFNYNYLTIKKKLKNKMILNLHSDVLFNHLAFCQKIRSSVQLKMLKIYERFSQLEQEKMKMSYMVMKTQHKYGIIMKITKCYADQNVLTNNFEQIAKQKKKQPEISKIPSILNNQSNNEHQFYQPMNLNVFQQVDQHERGENRYDHDIKKIEQVEQTHTRKFKY